MSNHSCFELHKKYAPSESVLNLVWTHSEIVAAIALEIVEAHPELTVDKELVLKGALLHDIGVYCTEPCPCHREGSEENKEPYIKHALIGAEIARKEGFSEEIVNIIERHTGVGITKEQIIRDNLPLPHKDFVPETLEEKIVAYADNFHTKKPRFKSYEEIKQNLEEYDKAYGEILDEWKAMFGIPDISKLNRKLYILPFDHRNSFAKMFGFDYERLTEEQRGVLINYRHVIYEGFLFALQNGVQKSDAAILTDEELGLPVLKEAKRDGITRILTVEKSGSDELKLEYGENFKAHIEKFAPEYAKILLHYNPDEKEKNARQIEKLHTLGQFCNEKGYKFLVELLGKDTMQSIKELQKNDIKPEVWKLEGRDNEEEMRNIVNQVKKGQENNAGVVILGRGEEKEKVEIWLRIGAKVDGVIGLAAGRTIFNDPLLRYHQKQISRDECVSAIGENFIYFIKVFEENKTK